MNLPKLNKTLMLLICCCFSLSLWSQEVSISGTVTFGFDEEPVPGYPVWLEVVSPDGVIFGADAETDEEGEYELLFDVEFNGFIFVVSVYTFDFCNGDELSLTFDISEDQTTIEGADFNVCPNIDPPDPEDGCEAYFYWDFPTDNPLTIQFYDLSYSSEPISAWAWDFGDGHSSDEQNPIHSYSEHGIYDVTLTISNDSCTGVIVLTVDTEHTQGCDCPEYYDPICAVGPDGNYITFDNICFALCENYSPDVLFDCDNGPCVCTDEYDPVCVITPGGIWVQFSNPCHAECAGYGEDSFVECEIVDPECQALFYVDQEDFNSLTVTFQDISFTQEGEIISWHWDFGDGHTSDEQNPTHTYDEPGIYEIVLTITTSEGCISTVEQHICIGLIDDCNCPSVYDPVCVQLPGGTVISFPNACEAECAGYGEDEYFVCDGNPDDCVCPDVFDPVCVQTDNGIIIAFGNACLAECEGYGEDSYVDCDSTDICICPDYYDPVCVITPDGDIISFLNECFAECEGFGEDSFVDCENDDCDCPDIYDPVCVVFDNGEVLTFPNICIALVCEDIDPNQIIDCENDCVCPDIYAPVCVITSDGEMLSFANSCYAECEGYGEDSYVDCDFGTPCDCPLIFDPVCVITDAGEILFFENACFAECEGFGEDAHLDCENDWEGCYAAFYTDWATDNPLIVSFVDISESEEGDIISWEWSFGDGTGSNEQNPTHTYAAEGVYEVTLTITTADGCTATTVQHICIGDGGVYDGPECQAIFFFEFDEENDNTFHFIDLSFGAIQSWEWNFGDGHSSDEQNPSHTYEEAGIYLVTLTVNSEDCESSMSMLVIASGDVIYNNECNALFVPFIIPDSNQVFFLNLSSPDAVSFEWDLGDGNTSSQPIVLHQYAEPGVYEVSLTITTADGCTNTFSITIDLEDDNFTGNPSYLTVTSTNDIIDDSTIRLYPNPVREVLNVDYQLLEEGYLQWSLINLDGKIQQLEGAQKAQGKHQIEVDVSELPPGIYFLRLQSSKAVKSLKFIKH